MIKDIQAYEKTTEHHCDENYQNDSNDVMVPGGSVIIVIITTQWLPPFFKGLDDHF